MKKSSTVRSKREWYMKSECTRDKFIKKWRTIDRHHIVPLAPDDVYILDLQSCQVVTFVTHKIFANWPDISAGRKVPFVVDRRRKSLFPNGSRHSAPFRPAAASHGWRRAEGKKGGRSERAWDSICIQYWFQSDIVDFHFCDLLLTLAAPALSVLRKRVFFEGQPQCIPMSRRHRSNIEW